MVITPGKDDGQTHWHFRYEGEHRLTDVISEPRDRNKPRTKVSFRYDPLGRRISKTSQQLLQGRPSGNAVTTRFVWEGYRLLQEIHDGTPLTYVYSDSQSYEPLARIDGVESPEIYWFHNAANGMPELLTDAEGQKAWEGINSPWGKLLRESSQRMPGYDQNLRMQGQYLDRETGLHYNLFRYYDPDSGRFTQQDPIGLAGGINLYQYAPNALGWVDPWGLSRCSLKGKYKEIDKAELPDWIRDSFKDGEYKTVLTTEDVTLYRVFGGNAKIDGSFVGTSPALNKIQAKIDAALLPEWKNTRQFEATLKIPKGTILQIGKVEKQIMKSGAVLEGGVDQILLPHGYPVSWITDVRFL